jgi:hypothetical protein
MSVGGREQQAPAPVAVSSGRPAATLAKRAGLAAGVAAVLFFCYWRQSLASPLSSDGAGNALQAWDILHGNLLLQHWWVSDVSFYTTELPQYAAIEALLGLGTWVVHVGAAMTYTLLVLLAALLAKGRARGREGLARALLAGGIMLAPQLSATSVLLLSPDHTGTAVPLLVIWLLIDRASPGGRPPGAPRFPSRGDPSPRTPLGRHPSPLTPLALGLLFIWPMVGDSITLLAGIIPLVLVCLLRACVRSGDRPTSRWYELSLAGAAAAAGVAGSFAPRVVAALGGYQQWHVGTNVDLSQLRHGAWVTLQAFLELFGANVFGTSNFGVNHPIEVVFVWLHLAGAIMVICAVGVAIRRFFGPELIVPTFAVAIVLNLAAYMISTHAQDLLGAREIAPVLPLGAVLAGRTLGDQVLAWTRTAKAWFVPVLAVVAVSYLAAFGYGAAQAAVPAANEPLASWLAAHRLSDGLATYWQANSTTLDSGGRIRLSAVKIGPGGVLVPYQWETDDADFSPSQHYANFVVAAGSSALPGMQDAAVLTFGRPGRVYHDDGYVIMVWNKNLLTTLG